MSRTYELIRSNQHPRSGLDVDHLSCREPEEGAPIAVIAAPRQTLRRKPAAISVGPSAPSGDGFIERTLDQFYTCPKVARRLYQAALKHIGVAEYLMLEPSAGAGAFLELMPTGRVGCDLDPKTPAIRRADFLESLILSDRRIAVIGNPPYGRNCDKAVAFFNHAARQAQVIAFVLPRTFRKASLVNRLDPSFHLVREVSIRKDAFLFRGRPRDVPTVFQIWERRSESRPRLPQLTRHPDFEFTSPAACNFAIQRVGAAAGTVHHNLELSPRSHYFIRGDVEGIMRQLTPKFRAIAGNTAGNPSLAKAEIVGIYVDHVSRRSR